METEKITHKGKTVLKKTKNNGKISYTLKGVYIGLDVKTGKQVTATITAKTLKELDRKHTLAKLEFEKNGSSKKERIQIDSFENLAEVWFDNYKTMVSSDNTLNRVRSYLDNYIIPRFGDFKPEKVESSDIQIWLNLMANNAREAIDETKSNKKGKTQDFGAIVHKLSDIFDYGITNFGLEKNPASTIKIPPKPKKQKERVKVLHDEEIATWLAFLETLSTSRANTRFKLIVDCLLAGGMRINELLACTIDDIDVKSSEIHINKTLMWKANNKKLKIKGHVVCKPTPKSDAGNRALSMPPEIIQRLIAWHDFMASYFQNHNLSSSSLIFPTIYGQPMCDRNERALLKKRLKSAGLPDYGFHIFRHTHASILLNAGANWKELQVRLGHKSISTTMDSYAELAPKKKVEAVNLFQQKINELSA